jgi:hypothetical protein
MRRRYARACPARIGGSADPVAYFHALAAARCVASAAAQSKPYSSAKRPAAARECTPVLR